MCGIQCTHLRDTRPQRIGFSCRKYHVGVLTTQHCNNSATCVFITAKVFNRVILVCDLSGSDRLRLTVEAIVDTQLFGSLQNVWKFWLTLSCLQIKNQMIASLLCVWYLPKITSMKTSRINSFTRSPTDGSPVCGRRKMISNYKFK